jgi:hypothetical protein
MKNRRKKFKSLKGRARLRGGKKILNACERNKV